LKKKKKKKNKIFWAGARKIAAPINVVNLDHSSASPATGSPPTPAASYFSATKAQCSPLDASSYLNHSYRRLAVH
jgi:hypothetical protein